MSTVMACYSASSVPTNPRSSGIFPTYENQAEDYAQFSYVGKILDDFTDCFTATVPDFADLWKLES